jgi:arylsulfatase A-like enzyme
MRPPLRPWLPLLALLLGCGPEPPPNVVVIAIDTLRADRLGSYGYARPTSPRLDALARDGVVFEQAIAQSPWTLPSFASILTGTLPQRHGAGQGKHCVVAPCGALSPEHRLLSEHFAAAGYRTASFVSNHFAGAAVGLGRGFERAETWRTGAPAVAAAVAWLESVREQPLFLFVVVIEPHAPFGPPDPAGPDFVDAAYDGPLGMRVDVPALALVASDADRRRVSDLYDADVWRADALSGRVLDALERLGIDDRTLVVVVADHGEELYERGTAGHGHSLYDELLRVPLIVRYPGGEPRGRVARQVRTMDVFPTVLEAAGLAVPPNLDAVALNALARGGPAPPETGAAVSEFTFMGPELRGLRTGGDKLVVDVAQDRARLFDLARDPGETADVAAERSARVAELRHTLATSDVSAVPGLYVWARGGATDRRARLRLESPSGGFGALLATEMEPGDVAVVSPDGRILTLDLALTAGDTDGVRVDVRDASAPCLITAATLDDAPFAGAAFRFGPQRKPVPRVPVETTVAALATPRSARPVFRTDQAMVFVESVLAAERPMLRFDAETAERLRALGYAE